MRLFFVILSFFICLTAFSQEFEVDFNEIDVFDAVNKVRVDAGLNALVFDEKLKSTSRMKAADMFDRQYFGHFNPDSVHWVYFVIIVGYEGKVQENLAMGFSGLDRLINAWVESYGHYKAMMHPDFKNTGITVMTGVFKGRETVIIVQHFGA